MSRSTRKLLDSYIWKNASPTKKRPDLLIVPYGLSQSVAVIEEKKKQADVRKLKGFSSQLSEYQQMENVVWGVLTDGEKWIIKKNNEIYYSFSNIDELAKKFASVK